MGNSLKVGSVAVGGRVWIAPMTGVSDLPFRQTASELGAAYVATEMVACAEFAKGRPDVVRRSAVGEARATGPYLTGAPFDGEIGGAVIDLCMPEADGGETRRRLGTGPPTGNVLGTIRTRAPIVKWRATDGT